MAFENKSNLIIMLCPCKEDDKQMSSEYFPSAEKPEDRTYGNFKVKLVDEKEQLKDLFQRELEVTELSSGNSVNIRHLQELEWKDNKAPQPSEQMEAKMLYLLDQIKSSRERFLCVPSDEPGSVIVHCSAGIGRTGTLISLYSLIEAATFLKHEAF